MRTCILTSKFENVFPAALAEVLREHIPKAARFAFLASEFEKLHEKTDKYFHRFLEMFTSCGITFADACVVDGRMVPETMQKTVQDADVVWLSGGDTPVQYGYFKKYGLVDALRAQEGVVIGMSAGAINMAETALCTNTCGHAVAQTYPALGLVPFSVEPHFDKAAVAEELLEISRECVFFGLCDEAVIIYMGEKADFIGDVFRLADGCAEQVSAADN